LVLFVYREGFSAFSLGSAAAAGWFLLGLILLLPIVQFVGQKKWVHYDSCDHSWPDYHTEPSVPGIAVFHSPQEAPTSGAARSIRAPAVGHRSRLPVTDYLCRRGFPETSGGHIRHPPDTTGIGDPVGKLHRGDDVPPVPAIHHQQPGGGRRRNSNSCCRLKLGRIRLRASQVADACARLPALPVHIDDPPRSS